MLINIFLIFIFWTLPCLIFFIAPFGGEISTELFAILLWANFLMYIPIILWFLLPRGRVEGKNKIIISSSLNFNIQLIILILNLYIFSSVGFTLGIQDDSIRTTIYENAGILWSLLVALYSISYVLVGSALGYGKLDKNIK